MESYTSVYSGTQIDEAVFFGYTAKDIGNTVVSQDIHEGDWTGTSAPYTYTYPFTPSANAFSHLPLVFFVTKKTRETTGGDRIDLDYKVSADLKTITGSSNKNLALTMVICG